MAKAPQPLLKTHLCEAGSLGVVVIKINPSDLAGTPYQQRSPELRHSKACSEYIGAFAFVSVSNSFYPIEG